MAAFNEISSGDFDGNGVVHGFGLKKYEIEIVLSNFSYRCTRPSLKVAKRLLLAILIIYLLPALASAGLWAMKEHPTGYRNARWSSAGILPEAPADKPAAIYVYSAMTGGFKGSVASHAWIVVKREGASSYDRYDKVGWGTPIRRNAYAPDAYWYSNMPRRVVELHGEEAERLIPKIEQAIADYPYGKPGGYHIYPGPNSNTFVAHVLRQVPELGVVLPPDAVGRDSVCLRVSAAVWRSISSGWSLVSTS
jgi:hypothetical protein